jgi:hypothetical protein
MSVTALLEEAEALVGRALELLEPGVLTGSDAVGVLERAVRVRNKASAIEARAAARVVDTPIWRSSGARSPAAFAAKLAGRSVGQTAATLDAVARLGDLPLVDEAVRAGRLSPEQLVPVAATAAERPDAERRLVDAAGTESIAGLRTRCAQVANEGVAAEERHRRLHARRSVRFAEHPDGACELRAVGPAASMAAIRASLTRRSEALFQRARAEGRREPPEAYAYDALHALATEPASAAPTASSSRGRRDTKVVVRIDHAALVRGHVERGETCDIPGVGPVPVSVVRDAIASGDAFLAAIVTDGVDVCTVAHLGRQTTAHQQTALQFSQPTCQNAACGATARLEVDHRVDWHHTHRTRLDELDRLCAADHDRKTHQGYRLEPGTGPRRFLSPEAIAAHLPPETVATLYTPSQLARFQPAIAAHLTHRRPPGQRRPSQRPPDEQSAGGPGP